MFYYLSIKLQKWFNAAVSEWVMVNSIDGKFHVFFSSDHRNQSLYIFYSFGKSEMLLLLQQQKNNVK